MIWRDSRSSRSRRCVLLRKLILLLGTCCALRWKKFRAFTAPVGLQDVPLCSVSDATTGTAYPTHTRASCGRREFDPRTGSSFARFSASTSVRGEPLLERSAWAPPCSHSERAFLGRRPVLSNGRSQFDPRPSTALLHMLSALPKLRASKE